MSPLLKRAAEVGAAAIARKCRPWTISPRRLLHRQRAGARAVRGAARRHGRRHRDRAGGELRPRDRRRQPAARAGRARSWCWPSSSRPTSTPGASSRAQRGGEVLTVARPADGDWTGAVLAGARRAGRDRRPAALPLDRRRPARPRGDRRALPRGRQRAGARRHPVARRPAARSRARSGPTSWSAPATSGCSAPTAWATSTSRRSTRTAGRSSRTGSRARQRGLRPPDRLPRALPARCAALRRRRALELRAAAGQHRRRSSSCWPGAWRRSPRRSRRRPRRSPSAPPASGSASRLHRIVSRPCRHRRLVRGSCTPGALGWSRRTDNARGGVVVRTGDSFRRDRARQRPVRLAVRSRPRIRRTAGRGAIRDGRVSLPLGARRFGAETAGDARPQRDRGRRGAVTRRRDGVGRRGRTRSTGRRRHRTDAPIRRPASARPAARRPSIGFSPRCRPARWSWSCRLAIRRGSSATCITRPRTGSGW